MITLASYRNIGHFQNNTYLINQRSFYFIAVLSFLLISTGLIDNEVENQVEIIESSFGNAGTPDIDVQRNFYCLQIDVKYGQPGLMFLHLNAVNWL